MTQALRVRAKTTAPFGGWFLGGDDTSLQGQVLSEGRPIAPEFAGDDVGRDGNLVVREHRLYRLVDLGRPGAGRLTIRLAPGTRAYAFTFG